MTYEELIKKIRDVYPLTTTPSKDELDAVLNELRIICFKKGYVSNEDLITSVKHNVRNNQIFSNESVHTVAMVNIAQEILDILDEK